MKLNTSRNQTYEGLPAAAAMGMAVFEQSGLKELIDSKFELDVRQKLTPGNAVKSFLGPMLVSSGRVAVYNVHKFYKTAPTDLLFGENIDERALNSSALSRNLDMLFTKDLGDLSYECYRRMADRYGFDSDTFNVDMTNFSVTSLYAEPDLPGAAFPERCGHAKDGHDEKLVYSLLSVTDGNGVVCYERPYDGSTSDSEMDRGAIDFLSKKVDPASSVLIADCKIVTTQLIEQIDKERFGMVSKCPYGFAKRIRDDIIHSIGEGSMDPSSVRKGWEIYDTDAEVELSDGVKKMLRFVAYRTGDDVKAGMKYLKDQGGKESEALFARFKSKLYNCEPDAIEELDEAIRMDTGSAYDKVWKITPVEVDNGYGHRGRPRKDEKPIIVTKYRVEVELVFNEERAEMLSRDRGIRVLVTNLPRAFEDSENVRFGASADTVLKLYLGQYRIEHAFRLMKSGFGINSVYLHKPSRENAMMFVIFIATLIWDVVAHVMKMNGIRKTGDAIADDVPTLIVVYDRLCDEMYFRGAEESVDEFLRYLTILKIDTDRLLN